VAEYVFNLAISADEYLRLYQGAARDVVARTNDGQRVRFAARYLRPFVTRQGIKGIFIIITDNRNKFIKIEQIG